MDEETKKRTMKNEERIAVKIRSNRNTPRAAELDARKMGYSKGAKLLFFIIKILYLAGRDTDIAIEPYIQFSNQASPHHSIIYTNPLPLPSLPPSQTPPLTPPERPSPN